MPEDGEAGDLAIEVAGLRKSYGAFEAVRGLSLDVRRGEIFAFLGPNGAGRTTTVEILEGFRRRDGGDVRVLGADPARGDRAWRARIGMVLQDGRTQPNLTVRETLELCSSYYPRPKPVADIIGLVGLEEKADERSARLSGGQRRRLDRRPGARRRPRTDLPRRADNRLRSGRAPRRMVGYRWPARPRQDRLSHHALPRRGARHRARQGRSDREPNETFTLKLSGASGATIADDTGQGTIIDDDRSGSFACRAVGLSLLGGDLAVSNDAYAPCKGATRSVGHVQLGSSLLLGASANALSSSTAQTPTHLDAAPAVNDRSVADATATGVNLTPGAAVVRATVLKSHAEARCGPDWAQSRRSSVPALRRA